MMDIATCAFRVAVRFGPVPCRHLICDCVVLPSQGPFELPAADTTGGVT